MRYDDASHTGSIGHSEPVARPDEDRLPPGSYGPATGNAITGEGTSTGAAGADSVGAAPGTITAVQGAGGQTVMANGAYQAAGQFGVLSMDMQGNFNYVRNPGTPDGVKDVFNYTLANAAGAHASTTLTIDIGQVAAAAAGQGVVTLPAGVELSDIHVNGSDLVVNLPDGTQMVIPGGAVFVPQIMIGDVEVPPTNLAALLIDSEPQPAAGPAPSSGGDFADVVPPLDPGVPLGDLIPPTELSFTTPQFEPVGQFENTKPSVLIETPDNPAGVVDASESVNEKGLPARDGNLPNEPAGSGEAADGNPSNNSDPSETNTGTIVFTAQDGLGGVTVNGVSITADSVGTTIQGQFGVMTITGVNLASGQITYSYTLTDNTSGDSTQDVFSVVVTDRDGDTATGSLTVHIVDDVPTAHNDTDSVDLVTHNAAGNVITGADTTSGAAGADTVGADNAQITAVSGAGGSDSTFQNGALVVAGQFGTLTIHADGSYSYQLNQGAPGGSSDVFTYTLTDGDGDSSTATLTINNPDHTPTIEIQTPGNPAVIDAVESVNEKGLPARGGEPAGSGEIADGNPNNNSDPSETNTGTIIFSSQDGVQSVTVDGVAITTVGQTIQGQFGVMTITSIDLATGQIGYSYTLSDNTSGDNTHDNFSVVITDTDGDKATATLTVNIIDDHPTARNDTDSTDTVTHIATGNVIDGSGTDGGTGGPGADTVGADDAHITGVTGFGATTEDGSSFNVVGQFGTLTINADGTYTYTENSQAPGGSVDTFTYTLTDGDGDSSTATLTITNPDHQPTLTVPTEGEAGTVVDEKGLPPHDSGLPAGSGEIADGDPNNNSDTSETTNGTISFTPGDAPATITIDGVTVTGTVGQTFNGAHGTLTITGFDANSGTITYSYTLVDSTHGDNTTDSFSIQVTDSDGDHANGTLTVDIVDDVPTAHADTNTVNEGGTATGNVETNDVSGADGFASGGGVTGVEAGDHTGTTVSGGVGTTIHGTFGDLVLNADGSYTYTSTANSIDANSVDVFTYTITDGDGDTSTTTLTINVNDVTLVADNQTQTVDEAALDLNKDGHDLAAGTVTGSNPGSTAETVQGQLNVNGASSYTAETITGNNGVFHLNADGSYTYTLTSPVDGTTADNGTNTINGVETFHYTATDADGNTVTGTVTINVKDDVPTAHADTNTVGEGGSVGGNVVTNDVLGADGAAPGGAVTGVAAGTNTSSPITTGAGTDIAGQFGTLHLNADGSYTYTANPDSVDSNQVDHFVYTITDGDGDTSTTTLNITVNNVSLPPDDQTKTVDEAALDLNKDGSDLAAGTVTGSNPGSTAETVQGQLNVVGTGVTYTAETITGNNGVFHLNADGSYTYTLTSPVDGPTADNGTNTINGVESFTYTATDADGNTTTGTVTINVKDDVPTAHADADSVKEDGPLVADGNVLTGVGGSDANTTDGVADTQGADGATVTGVKLPASASFTSVPTGTTGTTIDGAHGTLVLHADGTYTYTLNNADTAVQALGAGESTTDTFTYQITDGDGDTSSTTLTITINGTNDAPVVGDSTANVSEEGLTGANPDNVGSPTDTTNSVTATGKVAFTDVDTHDTHTVTLTAPANGSLTSDGFNVIWSGSGTNTLHAFQDTNGNGIVDPGEKAIATITIDNSGNYTVTLQGPIDHADPTVEDVNSFGVTVNVNDGHTTSTGTLTVNVEDDSPVNFTPDAQPSLVDDGTASATGLINDPGNNATGVNFIGADGFGSLFFTGTAADNGTQLTDSSDNPLTSHGQPIFLFGFGTGELVATTSADNSDPNAVVFTVDLTDGTGFGSNSTYTIDFHDTIDNGSGVAFNDLTSTAAGNVDFRGVGADSTAQPIDLLLSATSGGNPATVNTDSTSIGVGNQSLNVGDSVRIDFVSDLTTGTTSASDPTGFNFTGHDSSNGFVGLIPQVQGNQAQTVSFTVWALNTTLTDAGSPDSNPVAGGSDPNAVVSDGTSLTVTSVFVQDFQTGNTATLDISGLAAGTTEAVAFGISVTKNADGSVTFSGVQEGDHYGVTTSSDFNAIVVKDTSGSFDMGTFALSQTNTGNPLDLSFGVTAQDADGDTSSGNINVTLVPTGGTTTTSAIHTASTMMTPLSTTSTDSSSLLTSNDNFEQRAFNVGSNAVLMGALAAAGLEGLHGLQFNHVMAPGIDPILTPLHGSSFGSSGTQPLNDESFAPTHLEQPMTVAQTTDSPQHGGPVHDMVEAVHGLVHSDAKQAPGVMDLLHAVQGPAHSAAVHVSTAAAVTMPSAEQLAAFIAAHHGTAQTETSVAGNAPLHNEVVGKVLADSLHGGEGHGPSIDSLVNSLPHHGGAQDALQALASHGGMGVPFGHMGFAAAFGGQHAMLLQEPTLHPDAVPAAHG